MLADLQLFWFQMIHNFWCTIWYYKWKYRHFGTWIL